MSDALKKVGYIHSDNYVSLCDRLPSNIGRASLIHALIEAYGLVENLCMLDPQSLHVPPGKSVLSDYHSQDYISCLEKCDQYLRQGADVGALLTHASRRSDLADHGIEYDCPPFIGMRSYCELVARGSVLAAQYATSTKGIAIHWNGGRHHCKKNNAAGFCYVNDIVLCILELRKSFKRILYIDLDAHHGDGVENAFQFSRNVVTFSIHRYGCGFFPGSGNASDRRAINVPVAEGISGEQYLSLLRPILEELQRHYQPDALVIQCGADCLAQDPIKAMNLTIDNMSTVFDQLFQWSLPTVLLGGGGYDHALAARYWTKLTAKALEKSIAQEIPEHPFFMTYAPDFLLASSHSPYMTNENTTESLSLLQQQVLQHIRQLPV